LTKPSDFPRDLRFRNPLIPPCCDEEGVCRCLGAEFATLETRIVLQEGPRRLPGLWLDETKPFGRYGGIVDGVTEATFRFDQEQAERIAQPARAKAAAAAAG
jgi:cytochrome P450